MTIDPGATRSAAARPGLLPALKGVAVQFATLVLLQAVLAGNGWFLNRDLIAIHGTVGAVVVLVAAVQAGLAFAVGVPAASRRSIGVLTVAILVLSVVQYLLGLASRDSAIAAAWHVPNGVFIYGMTAGYSATVFRLGR
jgi:hypothetical protein